MKNDFPENIEIRITRKIPVKDFISLYKEAGWWEEKFNKDVSFVPEIVSGTFCFVGVFLNGRMIGMGRAISDGCSDAYIQDVVVLKEFRKMGIGAKIIRVIVNFLESKKIDWIALIAEPGTSSFYKKLGFQEMKNFKPMRLKK